MKIVLASASPRRRELLSQIVKEFEIIPAKGAEKIDLSLSAENTAIRLAENKCREVFSKNRDKLVIGCDTIVVFDGEILGKPKDRDDAINTLSRLSGNTHKVITGVCMRFNQRILWASDTTEVEFNELSEKFIKEYVDGGSPMDKAGSYGIQDKGVVKSFKGSYTNVVGLPVELVKKMLSEANE